MTNTDYKIMIHIPASGNGGGFLKHSEAGKTRGLPGHQIPSTSDLCG